MKMQEIRKMYTEQVADLLAQGYTIYPDTMGGSQGEIAHIDLTNGYEILRVLLEEEGDYSGKTYDGCIVIRVGRCTDPIREGGYSTIWNGYLETRFEIRLAKITGNWYTTMDESRAAAEKRFARWQARENTRPRELGDAYKSIALKWLKRQPGMKTCKLEHIEWMRLITDKSGKAHFEITAKGKTFTIRRKPA